MLKRTNYRRAIATLVATLALTGVTVATATPAEAVNGVRGTNFRVVSDTNFRVVNGV